MRGRNVSVAKNTDRNKRAAAGGADIFKVNLE